MGGLHDQYSTLRELGRGASGVVSLVKRRKDGRLFAAKEVDLASALTKSASTTNIGLEAARREVMAEARLMLSIPQHPSIVSLEEVLETPSSVIMIMEYVPQGTLRDLLMNGGPPPQQKAGRDGRGGRHAPSPENPLIGLNQQAAPKQFGPDGSVLPEAREESEIAGWLSQLVSALDFIHSHGIVHRDIKTDNILVASEGRVVKIGDFGVATNLLQRGTEGMATTTVGTPQYMSPEVMDGRPYNSQSDVWSLGVVAFELCNRHVPFPAGNMLALAHQITEDPAPRIDRQYGDGLNSVIQAMLTKSPDARPSMVEVARYLRNYRKGVDVFTGAATPLTPTPGMVENDAASLLPPNTNGLPPRSPSPAGLPRFPALPQQPDAPQENGRGRSREPSADRNEPQRGRSRSSPDPGGRDDNGGVITAEDRQRIFEESRRAAASNRKKHQEELLGFDDASQRDGAKNGTEVLSPLTKNGNGGNVRTGASTPPWAQEEDAAEFSDREGDDIVAGRNQQPQPQAPPSDARPPWIAPGSSSNVIADMEAEMARQRAALEELLPPTPRAPAAAAEEGTTPGPVVGDVDANSKRRSPPNGGSSPPFADPVNLEERSTPTTASSSRGNSPPPPVVHATPAPPPPRPQGATDSSPPPHQWSSSSSEDGDNKHPTGEAKPASAEDRHVGSHRQNLAKRLEHEAKAKSDDPTKPTAEVKVAEQTSTKEETRPRTPTDQVIPAPAVSPKAGSSSQPPITPQPGGAESTRKAGGVLPTPARGGDRQMLSGAGVSTIVAEDKNIQAVTQSTTAAVQTDTPPAEAPVVAAPPPQAAKPQEPERKTVETAEFSCQVETLKDDGGGGCCSVM